MACLLLFYQVHGLKLLLVLLVLGQDENIYTEQFPQLKLRADRVFGNIENFLRAREKMKFNERVLKKIDKQSQEGRSLLI